MSDEIENRFKCHEVDDQDASAAEAVRKLCLETALFVDRVVPGGREKSLALTKLEEASFWAGAGIARS